MVEAVPSTEQLGGFTLRSRTLMLIEITGKYSNPISMVEDVYNTKTGDKVPDLDGRNPSQKTKARLPKSWVTHKGVSLGPEVSLKTTSNNVKCNG